MSDLRYPNVYPPFDHVRVSRENQNVENQIRILLEEGLSRDLIYVDPVSGISTMQNREGCSLMIQFIRAHPGKPIMLYFFEISRMGRSFLNTLNMLLSLGESGTRGWSLSRAESWSRIEDKKLWNLMLSIFSWIADHERKNLIERTTRGMARAKAEGVTLGRQKRVIPWKRIQELQGKNILIAAIFRILDIHYTTLYRHNSQREEMGKS